MGCAATTTSSQNRPSATNEALAQPSDGAASKKQKKRKTGGKRVGKLADAHGNLASQHTPSTPAARNVLAPPSVAGEKNSDILTAGRNTAEGSPVPRPVWTTTNTRRLVDRFGPGGAERETVSPGPSIRGKEGKQKRDKRRQTLRRRIVQVYRSLNCSPFHAPHKTALASALGHYNHIISPAPEGESAVAEEDHMQNGPANIALPHRARSGPMRQIRSEVHEWQVKLRTAAVLHRSPGRSLNASTMFTPVSSGRSESTVLSLSTGSRSTYSLSERWLSQDEVGWLEDYAPLQL